MVLQGRSHFRRENLSICNVCDAFLAQRDVITHITDTHCGSNFYQCHLCRNYSSSIRSSLFQHQRDKHNVSYYYLACPVCMQFCSPHEKNVTQHMINVHSRIENVCICNYCNFKSFLDLDAHFMQVHSNYLCVFKTCQSVCQDSLSLFKHYMDHHFPKLILYYCCSECDTMFPKENSLYQHKRDKHGIIEEEETDEETDEEETIIEFHCPVCSFTTCNKKSYQQHSFKHPNYYFNCSFPNCNYETKLFWSLTQHTLEKHLSQQFFRYTCYECEEISYARIDSLIQHLRDKHSVVRYCCLCKTYEDDLSDHILSDPDHSYEVFWCRTCDEEYEEKEELIDHLIDDHVYINPLLRRLCYGD